MTADGDAAPVRVRIRGIYATALTRLFAGDDATAVVAASAPIRERFDRKFPLAPADAAVGTTGDRQGVGVTGGPDAVGAVVDRLRDVGVDALAWDDPTPRGAVFDGVVRETLGGGAVVDLGPGEGYLPYGASDDYVETGDRVRVQVRDPEPPWSDDRPEVATGIELAGRLATLVREDGGGGGNGSDRRGGRTGGGGPGGTAADLTDLLSTDVPDGWRVRWGRTADDADFDALDDALAVLVDRADDLDAALVDRADDLDAALVDRADEDDGSAGTAGDDPGPVWTGPATAWTWFGRESRFALDGHRRAVVPTMPGHHRIKAGDERASAAVDFAEAVCGPSSASGGADGDTAADGDPEEAFPFDVVTRQFGPVEGDAVAIGHGKPDGRLIVLGRGEVTDRDPGGEVTVRREMSPGGTYDALGVEREAGDVAVTKFAEGRWWYPTVYRGREGDRRGTYVNVCTPVEVFPDAVRYVDLHVDVVKHADGTVERVDDDELDAAVADGTVPEPLAERARTVASAVENAL